MVQEDYDVMLTMLALTLKNKFDFYNLSWFNFKVALIDQNAATRAGVHQKNDVMVVEYVAHVFSLVNRAPGHFASYTEVLTSVVLYFYVQTHDFGFSIELGQHGFRPDDIDEDVRTIIDFLGQT